MGIQALPLISRSEINMNLIVLFCSLSMTSVIGQSVQWILVGGKNYDFNSVQLTHGDAKARCIREGGKLFEPRDTQTNRDVFVQAGATLGQAGGNKRDLWIGVSDIGTDNEFTYLSDESLVNFVCVGSDDGRAGCWETAPTAACAETHGSICERDGETTPAPPPPPPPPASGS